MKAAFLLGLVLAVFVCRTESRIICYWGTWSYGWPGNGKFDISDIDANLCTHVIYSFVGISANGDIETIDPWFDIESDGFDNFVALKNQNPDLKVMVNLGGWNEASVNFSTVVADPSIRSDFVENIKDFLGLYEFDGMDIAWHYPGQRGGDEGDIDNFVQLVQELRELFDTNGWILSASVPATESSFDLGYDVSSIDVALDFINVMTLDFYGDWSDVTGATAPLYAQLTDDPDTLYTVNASINAWIDAGAFPENLNLGLALYGRTFQLFDATDADTGALVIGVGEKGVYSREPGMWTNLELCEQFQNEPDEWTVTEVTGNYAYASRDDFWIGYDTIDTIRAKAAFAKDLGLGGITFWSINFDDFLGSCGEPYPLVNAGIDGFNGR